MRKAVFVTLVGSPAKGSRKALPRVVDLSVPGASSLLISMGEPRPALPSF